MTFKRAVDVEIAALMFVSPVYSWLPVIISLPALFGDGANP
jgi:hypothetical protein